MTITELVGLLGAVATVFGVVLGFLVFARDRSELRELESITSLIEMKAPRNAELLSIQARLLDRYLRSAKRRSSGTTRMIWALLFGAVGLVAYLVGDKQSAATLVAAGSFVVAFALLLPLYAELIKELVRAIVQVVRSRNRARHGRSR